MKRHELIRHLESHGCRLLREGGRHTVYVNPAVNATSAVPRHTEIYEFLARRSAEPSRYLRLDRQHGAAVDSPPETPPMIVSWNWLSQYVRLDMPVEELTRRLALSGLNHESTEEVGGDLAIDLEVTSNRPDCLGHLGVAREIGVLFDRRLQPPEPKPKTSGKPVEEMTSITVEAPDLCPRFTARVVTGCRVGESPWWMRKRLETVGVRPISNVVDVTNYVMLECGQPLHAYDLPKLAGRRLVVRRARAGEKLTAINNKVYDLAPEMLVIADAERPVGLAGVMGGLETEIGPGTTDVLIEAARFDPMSVHGTSRSLGLHSPSSYRFERGLDPERTEWASRRTADLILETAGGRLHPGVIDVGKPPPERPAITLRLSQIPRVLGIEIDRGEVARILAALGLEPAGETTASLTFRPPSWRADLEREIDLIEEAARIHGYEHIPEDRAVPLARSAKGRRERVEAEVRGVLTGLGIDEACTYSLVAEPVGRAIEGGAGRLVARRAFDPQAGDGAAAEPHTEPAGRPGTQRGARDPRRRPLRDRPRLPARPLRRPALGADPTGDRLRP